MEDSRHGKEDKRKENNEMNGWDKEESIKIFSNKIIYYIKHIQWLSKVKDHHTVTKMTLG